MMGVKQKMVSTESEIQQHPIKLEMVLAPPDEVYAGTDVILQTKVICPEMCDLQGSQIRIVDAQGEIVTEVVLRPFDGAGNETDEFVVRAPVKPGEYTWTAIYPGQEREGFLHEEIATPFTFIVKPHTTSMAVWDVPSPIVYNTEFKLKVGVKCSAECRLTDKEVEIYDQEGIKVATGTLGEVPWSGTAVLYWTEVEMKAPGTVGYYKYKVKFPKSALELPHEGASYTFGFGTARPPEYMVTVEVIDKNTQTPMKNAQVTLHSCGGYPYRDCTDESGVARISVPKDEYELYVVANDKEPSQTTVEVTSDVTTKAELLDRAREWWE
jgi:hypothetical protein